MWRAGAVESSEAAPGVPVLRELGAVFRRRRDPENRGARPRQGTARNSGSGSRLAGRETDRAVPELQGGVGLRSRSRGPELRLLWLAVARRLRRDQGAHPAAE